MGLITGALQIGRSALLAYQSALQAVGNNISNAGSASYTRQTPVLSPDTGVILPEGYTPGGGVTLSSLQRNVDQALENRIRVSLGAQSGALAEQQTLSRVESVMNELSDNDLSTLLQKFFNALSSLQNQPQDSNARGIVLTAGESLANEVQRQRRDVLSLRDELNTQLAGDADRANELASDITDLNVRITALESSGSGSANALRDQRDSLLRELSGLVQISVREQPGGGVYVYVGNEPLIQDGLNRGITTTLDTTSGDPKVVVRFADNNGPIQLLGGEMAGLVASRDTHVLGQVDALNSLAQALINEVNKVHSQGQGLQGITGLSGSYDVLDVNVALNSTQTGLNLVPKNGSFLMTVKDKATGTSTTTTVTVDLDGIGADDSLTTLAAKISGQVPNVTASVTADRRMQLQAADGFEFTFAQDSSNVLASLGINTFFTGTDAQDLSVNSMLTANSNLLAAATQNTPGDGSNAANLAALGSNALPGLQNKSLSDFYNSIASNVAVKGSAATQTVSAADAIYLSLSAQRESISGVSLDEETISLLRLERSFQGAARYSAVVDRLIEEMLTLVS